jgi:hypothetical protein
MTNEKMVCRARIAGSCLDGRQMSEELGYEGTMADDGTYDGESIVCDPCYLVLLPFTPSGAGLTHELNPAIERARNKLSRSEGG